ncbi:unnamed protein product [Boreogadus saida]
MYTERSVKLPQVERAVGVCKKVVSALSNSWKRRLELAKAQAELGLPAHQLITDTPTSVVAEEAASLPSAAAARDEPEVPAKKQKKSLSSYFKKAAKPNGPSVKQRVHCKGAQLLSPTGLVQRQTH